jgi:Mrp family chromosome partitioning ATPase
MPIDSLQKAVTRARDEGEKDTEPRRALVGPLTIDDIRYSQSRIESIDPERAIAHRLVAHRDGRDSLARSFSTLAMQILQKMRRQGMSSLAVVAPSAGAGASMIAANLSIALAREPNQTVLAVDANLRAPSLADTFGIDVEYGLVDFLVNPGIPRLVLMPGRNSVDNADALLASKQMAALMKELHDRYDSRIVVYDMPPLLDAPDALALLPRVDSALLVIREGRTTAAELDRAKQLLQGIPMVGAVVNGARGTESRR